MEKVDKSLIRLTTKQVAPCGMNCGICRAYLREKNKCPGCRAVDTDKAISVIRCKIKNCDVIQKGKVRFCFECEKFPCAWLKNLDKRYRSKYGMSEIENLENIRDNGIDEFVKSERKKWQSEKGIFCVHNKKYY